MKNLGTTEALYNFGTSNAPSAVTPGLVPQIASIYRAAPHFALNVSKLRFVFEYELSFAKYGTGNINISDGLYANGVDVANHRTQLMLMYFF
jgi:hypothetical protein